MQEDSGHAHDARGRSTFKYAVWYSRSDGSMRLEPELEQV